MEADHPDLAWTQFKKEETYQKLDFQSDLLETNATNAVSDDDTEIWTHFSTPDIENREIRESEMKKSPEYELSERSEKLDFLSEAGPSPKKLIPSPRRKQSICIF